MIPKRLHQIVRSDSIVRTDRPESKAFSVDNWLVGVPVAGYVTGVGLHGVLFHKMWAPSSHRYSSPSSDGYMTTGQWAVIEGIVWVAFGLFISGFLVIFANNLSRRWRIIHFITSVVIAALFFSIGGQRP